jgi:hypothetical protein
MKLDIDTHKIFKQANKDVSKKNLSQNIVLHLIAAVMIMTKWEAC